jgi:hypothetical protein
MKAKTLDGEISDHLRSSQQWENSIVVCNLQITNKLETFYVDRGKLGGDSREKYLLIFFFEALVWLQSTCALLAEMIKSGQKPISKQMRVL